MRPNLGRVGRDLGQLGQCPNSHRLLLLKASLTKGIRIICFLIMVLRLSK